jgi:hypothetical protein
MTDKQYKFANPYEWLQQHVFNLNEYGLRNTILTIATKLDFDDLQEIFQSDMEQDGYFISLPSPDGLQHEGVITVCAHRVVFRYWDFNAPLTDELREQLEIDAEARASEMITQGYHSGELNCLWVDGQDEEEIRGWWQIDS